MEVVDKHSLFLLYHCPIYPLRKYARKHSRKKKKGLKIVDLGKAELNIFNSFPWNFSEFRDRLNNKTIQCLKSNIKQCL